MNLAPCGRLTDMSTTTVSQVIDRGQPAWHQSRTTVRELDRRAGDGIVVRLLWNPQTSRVSIEVDDQRSGDSLEFEVDGSEALSAFHHPYAYAASLAA